MALPHEEAFKTLFLTILLINTLEADVCNESLSTVQPVSYCPRNFTELQLAVKRKRCDALANKQTCVTDPKKFVYHCLVNQQNDGFVEVCAPEWILSGFCGYYDTVLHIIGPDINKDCTKFPYPCPVVFNSSDSYKYQVCYEVRKKEQGTKICDEKVHPPTSENHVYWIVPSIFAIGFFIALVFTCLKCWKIYFLAGKKNFNHMISSYLPRGQTRENQVFTGSESNFVTCNETDNENQSTPTMNKIYRESNFVTCNETDNENQSTPTMNKIYRTPSESNATTEEDTSGKEEFVSKRKNTPHTGEESKRRIAYTRQKVEKNREIQRRLQGSAPSTTPRQNKFNSAYPEMTNNSTPNRKRLKSTLSDSILNHERTPFEAQLKHSISESDTGHSREGKTGVGRISIYREVISIETDFNAATEGDISEVGEEDEFIKKSKNTPSSEGNKSGKKRNGRKRGKGNKGKAKQNKDYETN